MSLKSFEAHLDDPAPAFHCFRCEDKKEKLELVVRLRHVIEEPATANDLSELRQKLGEEFPEALEFYSQHNGMMTYLHEPSEACGLIFYRIDQMDEMSEAVRERFDYLQDDPTLKQYLTGVAFGEIHASGNYFVFVTEGPHAGSIYYSDHDDVQGKPFAPSFPAFLKRIVKDPAQFLYDVGCYTRYSDGKTKSQWIPKKYLADAKALRK
jgi:hypothetical protein